MQKSGLNDGLLTVEVRSVGHLAAEPGAFGSVLAGVLLAIAPVVALIR
jgi:hypothetical protein